MVEDEVFLRLPVTPLLLTPLPPPPLLLLVNLQNQLHNLGEEVKIKTGEEEREG